MVLISVAPKAAVLSAGGSSCPAALPQQFVYEAAVVLVGSRRGEVMFLLQGGVRCCLSGGPRRG